MPLTETASPLEVLWTLFGIVGLVMFGILAWRAYAALAALRRLGLNGGRKIAGKTVLVKQIALGASQVIVVATGIVQALAPPAKAGLPLPFPALVATLGIVGMELIIMGVGVFGLIRADVLDRYLAAHDSGEQDATNQARHAETMTELTHNTEVTTEAMEAFHSANSANIKIAETNKVAGEAASAAIRSTDKLRDLMERLELERGERATAERESGSSDDRADARSDREQDRQDIRDDRRDERERNRT